jgi:hypothetical protein
MKTLCLDRNAALAMAAEMVVWELIFAARITTATPESAQSVA